MPWPTRARSWTDPTKDKNDLASLQSKFQFGRGGGLSGIRGALAGQNQLGQATQQALGSIAQIMQQRKQDQIAQTLLQSKAQGGDDIAAKMLALKLPPIAAYQAYQQERTNVDTSTDQEQQRRLREAQITKLNAPDETNVDTPYGKMTPYQWGSLSNRGGTTDPWKNAVAVARGWLKSDGTFTNSPEEVNLPATTDASQGPYVKLVEPTQKAEKVIPWGAYAARTGQQANPQENNQDQFVAGKKYKDAQGNMATYLGNGQWSQ